MHKNLRLRFDFSFYLIDGESDLFLGSEIFGRNEGQRLKQLVGTLLAPRKRLLSTNIASLFKFGRPLHSLGAFYGDLVLGVGFLGVVCGNLEGKKSSLFVGDKDQFRLPLG